MITPCPNTFWTIGHSTRPIDEFIILLQAHNIQRLVDVRTIPRSRHNPQFNTEQLSSSLTNHGIPYVHMPQLGGFREATKDSINVGWRNASSRGYADYMQSIGFWSALDILIASSRKLRTAIMCAEALPWRCHRTLIADALATRGCEVHHILSETKSDRHQLTSFAQIENGMLFYPEHDNSILLF